VRPRAIKVKCVERIWKRDGGGPERPRWGVCPTMGCCGNFNAKRRDGLLNGEIFYGLVEATIVIKSRRRHGITTRQHASPGGRPPAPAPVQWPTPHSQAAAPAVSAMIPDPLCTRLKPHHPGRERKIFVMFMINMHILVIFYSFGSCFQLSCCHHGLASRPTLDASIDPRRPLT